MTELETVYASYKDKVLGYLRSKVNNAAVAEDICSDVFVKVASHLDRFNEGKASLSTWIFNITRNTLYDYFRTRKVWTELQDDTEDDEDLAESLCRSETLERLADALELLPERERDLIVRHYYYGEKLKDWAAGKGMSYTYAKVLHKSALNKLKNCLEKE